MLTKTNHTDVPYSILSYFPIFQRDILYIKKVIIVINNFIEKKVKLSRLITFKTNETHGNRIPRTAEIVFLASIELEVHLLFVNIAQMALSDTALRDL